METTVLTQREQGVIFDMKEGLVLWPIRNSRNYGLFRSNDFNQPVSLVQRKVVENLVKKKNIKVTCPLGESVSRYTLNQEEK